MRPLFTQPVFKLRVRPCISRQSNASCRFSRCFSAQSLATYIEPAPDTSAEIREPLFLIQGWASCAADWGAIPKLLASAGNRAVVTYDPYGFGASPIATATEHSCTASALARDAVQAAQSVGIAKAHILGISLGGMVAQELALSHSEEFRPLSLTLCATTPGGREAAKVTSEFLNTFNDWHIPGKRNQIISSFLTRSLPSDWAAGRRKLLEKVVVGFAELPRDATAILAQARAVDSFSGGKLLGSTLQHQSPRLRSLVIHGAADQVMLVSNARLLAEYIGPQCNLDIWNDCGHLLYLQQPQRFVRVVNQFLLDVEQTSFSQS